MFKLKQAVTYPFHGVGKIQKIMKHQINGEHVEYYSIKFDESGIVVDIPVEKAKELGLSELPKKEDFIDSIDKLGADYKITESTIKEIKNITTEDLKTSDVGDVVDIFNKIYSYKEYREKTLQVSLKQILEKAAVFLSSLSKELLDIKKVEEHPKLKLLVL